MGAEEMTAHTFSEIDVDFLSGLLYNTYTARQYRSAWRLFLGVNVDRKSFQQVVTGWTGLSKSTIRVRKSAVSFMLDWLGEQGAVADFGVGDLRFPEGAPERRRERLTDAQIERMLSATGSIDERALLLVLRDTGLRLGTVGKLNTEYLTGESFFVTTKRGTQIEVFTTPPLRELPADIHTEYLFGDKPAQYKRLWRMFRKICKRAGMGDDGIEPHQFRHTLIGRIADKYGMHVAQQVAGHRSLNTTARYAKPGRSQVKNAIANL